ncbi:hypothetical protein [Seleniivibrio woodruffii]|uniref:Uncharacterized protein n=1 Tax=Seleniivibrio woodruffii TaxID=1078050 RepID=A0A4R1K6S7_9BACT|nr:hypothetical protein [Seleniivibrio woodruffii]TCK59932.1 hypothetical protein C8D98_2101 [Seleniivibrio woodruffii]TVZ35847.1 hypothetical protein OF66_1465 [Seleniivibrio woodruffii]
MSDESLEFLDKYQDEFEEIFYNACINAMVLDRQEFVVSFRPLYYELLDKSREAKKFYSEVDSTDFKKKLRDFVGEAQHIFIQHLTSIEYPVSYLKALCSLFRRKKYTSLKISTDMAFRILYSLVKYKENADFSFEERVILKGLCFNIFSYYELSIVMNTLGLLYQGTDYNENLRKMGIDDEFIVISRNNRQIRKTFLPHGASFRSLIRNMLTPEMINLINSHENCPQFLKFEEYEKGDFMNNLQKDMEYKLRAVKFLQHSVNTELYGMSNDESYASLANELGISVKTLQNDFSEIKKVYKL